MQKILFLVLLLLFINCGEDTKETIHSATEEKTEIIRHARGLKISQEEPGYTVMEVTQPWPGAEKPFRYALVPRDLLSRITFPRDAFDAIIPVPVERVILTSTTHVPALELLGETHRLVGFPQTHLISSPETRELIDKGQVKEVGSNEALNVEEVLALQPDLVIGFSIASANKTYENLERSGIPVVYNGDWMEESPLGKAEWIKFFAPFFQKENKAETLFSSIETSYNEAKAIAATASNKPDVLCGALWKDIWYLPGGESWMARFLEDANANYLWSETGERGSLSLSVEAVLEKGAGAEYWIAPSQYTAYEEMKEANRHYTQFRAFKEGNIFTYARTKGPTGGLLYYELAPLRPDLVLKDLIHHLHPGLLNDHEPYFFKSLQ